MAKYLDHIFYSSGLKIQSLPQAKRVSRNVRLGKEYKRRRRPAKTRQKSKKAADGKSGLLLTIGNVYGNTNVTLFRISGRQSN